MSLQIFLCVMEVHPEIILCPFCGMPTEIVWVHGHGQCMVCKMVMDECCRGEQQSEKLPDEKNKQKNNDK